MDVKLDGETDCNEIRSNAMGTMHSIEAIERTADKTGNNDLHLRALKASSQFNGCKIDCRSKERKTIKNLNAVCLDAEGDRHHRVWLVRDVQVEALHIVGDTPIQLLEAIKQVWVQLEEPNNNSVLRAAIFLRHPTENTEFALVKYQTSRHLLSRTSPSSSPRSASEHGVERQMRACRGHRSQPTWSDLQGTTYQTKQ